MIQKFIISGFKKNLSLRFRMTIAFYCLNSPDFSYLYSLKTYNLKNFLANIKSAYYLVLYSPVSDFLSQK